LKISSTSFGAVKVHPVEKYILENDTHTLQEGKNLFKETEAVISFHSIFDKN
jgi:hypothetical protein